jgi:hypothetical protein
MKKNEKKLWSQPENLKIGFRALWSQPLFLKFLKILWRNFGI